MRANAEALDLAADAAVAIAFEDAGVALRRRAGFPHGFEADIDGRKVRFVVEGAALIDPTRATAFTARRTPSRVVPLVVADRILGAARPILDEAGWSWLDRRGRIHLRAQGIIIDVDIDPLPRAASRRRPSRALESRGTQEVAVELLLAPENPSGVRAIARDSGFAPSTISRSLATLRVSGLVRRDGTPVIPDLFWALAELWMPEWIALASPVELRDDHLDRLGANIHDLTADGWAVGDTRAALAWHAPLVASADAAPSIYVPDLTTFHRAIEQWGRAPSGATVRTASVAVAPVRALTRLRFKRPGESWPVVHPLFVALDLATDRSRGHQILDEWTPTETLRVW